MLHYDVPEERELVLGYFESRFGVPPETFSPYAVTSQGRDLWLVSRPERDPELARFHIDKPGLRVLRRRGESLKPTSAGLRLIGRHATRRCIDLEPPEAARHLANETLGLADPPGNGFVVVREEGRTLGCGLVVDGALQPQLPRGWRS